MKRITLFCCFFLSSLLVFAQTYNQGLHFTYITTDSMEVYYKENSNIVKQRSYKINNTTTSTKLWYSSNDFVSSTLINEFVNDTSISIYRWAIADKIEVKADSLKGLFNSQTVAKYSSLLDSMSFYISDIISPDTLKTELFQVVFYHNSTFKSIKRYNNGSDSCYCTSYVGYVGSLTSFQCNQDIIVNVEDFQKYLEDSIDLLERYNAEYLIDFLENYSEEQISFEEVLNRIYEESGGIDSPPIFIAFPCPWLSGTDCGCCANYQGPCIMCSVICLIHDYQCQKCKPWWYCLPGCKPTPCR